MYVTSISATTSAYTIDNTDTHNDYDIKKNLSTPTSLPPPNINYTVFVNFVHTGLIIVTSSISEEYLAAIHDIGSVLNTPTFINQFLALLSVISRIRYNIT